MHQEHVTKAVTLSQDNGRGAVYLQIAFGGESPAADGADERLLSGVRALVDLQGAGR